MRRSLVGCALLVFTAPLPAQSLLYRSPNLSGTWVADPGVVQFNFAHRFYVAPTNSGNKVTNFPTFTLEAGVVRNVGLGLRYGSNSQLVLSPDYRPNEIELFARWRLLGSEGRDGFAVALTPAYNRPARSFDAEASVDYTRGVLTLSGAARYINQLFGVSGSSDAALAGGVSIRLNQFVALGGDFAKLLDHDTTAAWSAGLVLAIPGSPHTFSLHASKAITNTIQSSSFGGQKILYGFEFTIPIHPSRFAPWFHKTPAAAVTGDVGAPVAATVTMGGMKFAGDTVVVSAGQAVRWNNTDPLDHTVTFDGGEPGSALIAPHSAFVHRFDRPGTYPYHCTPHPFMKGVVIVR